MSDVTCKCVNVGKLADLTGCVGRIGSSQNVHERLVVRKDVKFPTFEEVAEMFYHQVGRQQFVTEGAVMALRWCKLS